METKEWLKNTWNSPLVGPCFLTKQPATRSALFPAFLIFENDFLCYFIKLVKPALEDKRRRRLKADDL